MRRLRVLPGTRHGMRDPIALPVMALGGLAAGAAALALSPATGAAVLAGMAQTDGLTGHLDRVLPSSSFKLLSLWVLLLLALTLGTNPLTRGRPRPSWPMAATALFALWLGLSHLLAVAPGNGADHVRGFWATLLLVPILGLTIRDARDLRLVLVALVVSGVVSALCVIVETLLGQRLTVVANPDDIAAWQGVIRSAGASAYNPTTAAHLLVASLTLALGLAVGDARGRVWWTGAAAVMLLAMPMMGARSALLALVLGALLLGWSARRSRYFSLAAALVVVAGIAALPFLPDSIVERFSAVGDLLTGDGTVDRTLLRRVSYNLIGMDLFLQHPLTGVGPGGFPDIYASHDYRWFPGRELEPRQLHNSYLEVLAETGLPGLALFLTATLGAMARAWRAGHLGGGTATLSRAVAIAMAAFLFASLFMPNEDNKFMWIFVALACRAAWIAKRDPAR